MGLDRYREMRDFKITPEPRGRVARSKARERSFVIQKHAASHLHYDFRLELNGVLLSWAIPKGPSLDPGDKRLAMHVEDHPLEYGGFEGIIPPKQYGAGTVMLWDRGVWIPDGDPETAYAKGHLKFQLEGSKLHGGWSLIRTRGSKYGGRGDKAWLLIKERDEFARDQSIVESEPNSVVSGRSLDEIASDRENEWHSNRSVKENVRAGALKSPKPGVIKRSSASKRAQADRSQPKRTKAAATSAAAGKRLATVSGAKKASMPAMLTPTLATLVTDIPAGDDWVHEIKYDGYRMLCRIEHGKVRIFSRNGKEWTGALEPIVTAMQQVTAKEAWIDGELAVLDQSGHTSFQALQNALADPSSHPLVFFAFDLLHLDGYDLREAELADRKRVLQELLGDGNAVVRYSMHVDGHGPEFFAQACKLGVEGSISKRASSTYSAGRRTTDWLKVKCVQRQEMVIGGFTEPQGSRSGFGALLLGVNEQDGLRYSGKVGTGFNDKMLTELYPMLTRLEQPTSPFTNPPRGYEAKGVHWTKPQLVAEIAFTEWTKDGTLRHPSFQGLRADKNAREVVRERPVPEAGAIASPTKSARTAHSGPPSALRAPVRAPSGGRAALRRSPSRKDGAKEAEADNVIAGVKISNPDKLLFPEAGLRKRDLAQYYVDVAKWILPHVQRRPLALVRCPDGWKGQCFYQKHANASVHEAVSRVEVPEGGGTATYFAADSPTALVGLLQWGVVELHPWGSRLPKLDRPDRLIFDFDPGDGVEWPQIVEAAGLLRTLLGDLGLTGFLKTTGGKGLHVVVPVKATLEWDAAKGFTRSIAEFFARAFPDRFTATVAKAHRAGKIYVDYLRNAEGATAIAPYAIRARENAPVSTPIQWDELESDVRFAHFNVKNVPQRLQRLKSDPWAAFAETRQTVTKAMWKRLGSSAGP